MLIGITEKLDDRRILFLQEVVERFDLDMYLENNSWEPYSQGGYTKILSAVADHEKFATREDDFEAMFVMSLAEEILFKGISHGDFYYDLFLTARWNIQICKLMMFNDRIRGLFEFDEFDGSRWNECWDNDFQAIVKYSRRLFSSFGIVLEDNEIGSIESTTLLRTIREYYGFWNPEKLQDAILSHTKARNYLESPLGEIGWFMGAGSLKFGWHRFLSCIYLIDFILETSGQWVLIESRAKRDSLNQLVKIGNELFGGEGWGTYSTTKDGKARLGDESWMMHHRFSRQAMIVSLITNNNQQEIYAICSKFESLKEAEDPYILRPSFFIKKVLFLTSGEYRLSSIFGESYKEMCEKFNTEDIYPLYKFNKRSDAFDSANYLKNALKSELEKISDEGLGVVRRIKGKPSYMDRKRAHLRLYRDFGVKTSIPREGRGRKVAILFPHQNKIIDNIESEIRYLPYSLNKIVTKFESMESVLVYPYLVVMTYDHLFQFSRCLVSVGRMDYEESWVQMKSVLERVVEIFNSTCSRGIFMDGFNQLVQEMDSSQRGSSGLNRLHVISLQNKIKSLYLEKVQPNLEFTDLFSELRGYTATDTL